MKMKQTLCKLLVLLFLFANQKITAQQPLRLTVQPSKPIAPIPSTMWAIFFEDINFAADGGLYAELVKNRSFEFPMPMMGWHEIETKGSTASTLIINHGKENTANLRYASVSVNTASGVYGLSNEG